MPVRTAERDVLQQMNAALNQTIASQSSPERFGAVMFSARFITQHTLEDITTTGGISKYEKVSKIVSAVMDYIVVSGSPQKFDEFVLLLRNEFQFDHLSQQLQECIDVCRSERSPPSAPARDTPTLASEHLVDMTAPPEATDGAAVPTSSPNRADSVPDGFSDRPTLPEFISMLGAGRRVNLAQQIGADYYKFGTLLLDDDGSRTEAIVQKHQREAENINMHIFRLWLEGKGKQPVSWATLVGVLRDMELNRIAADVLEIKSSKATQPLLTGDPSTAPLPGRSEGSLPTLSFRMEMDTAEIKHPKGRLRILILATISVYILYNIISILRTLITDDAGGK